jgi:membrane protein YdbS with pleckstrin-like domain
MPLYLKLNDMLNDREKKFMEYWEASRQREGQWQYQLLTGIPIGLLFSLPVILIVFTAKYWYVRADMQSNAIASPTILIIAVIFIAVFIAIFYKRYQWDQKEQYYLQLKAREDAEKKSGEA